MSFLRTLLMFVFLTTFLQACIENRLPYPSESSGVRYLAPVVSFPDARDYMLGIKDLPKNYLIADTISNKQICKVAITNGTWSKDDPEWVKEAKRRGLDCGIKPTNETILASNENKKSNIDITTATCALMPSIMSCRFLRKTEIELCESINGYKRGIETYDNYSGSLKEAKRRGLNCGVRSKNKTVLASKPKKQTQTKPITSSADFNAERKKRIELERK